MKTTIKSHENPNEETLHFSSRGIITHSLEFIQLEMQF